MNEEALLGWEAYEYEPKKHSADWYWTVGIITVALVVISILLDNTLFGIVIGLSVGLLVFHRQREPRITEVDITPKGIRHDSRLYLFEHLQSYHIDERESVLPKLVLKSKKLFMPYIVIRLDSVSPEELEKTLDGLLLEDTHPEPIFHKILEYLGF